MNRILKNIVYHFPRLLSDRRFIELMWELKYGYKLDLDNPKTFNEKLNWLKLNDRNPIYTALVDKCEVKKYVAEKIGYDYVIPTLGVWNSFDEIDFDSLPESFVLKCTHDSGSTLIVKDKKDFDKGNAGKVLSKALKHNFFWNAREWPYKNVHPRIIAEPYLADLQGCLNDYKFFCNNGKVKFLFIATERFSEAEETKFDFFDREFNHLEFTNGHPMALTTPAKPKEFEQMVELCERLSSGIPFVRVDLYDLNGKILFGEYTFSHWGGFVAFTPPEWDRKLGDMIQL